MPAYFANLAPHELEMLALLSEECGEVCQAIGKTLRHGPESYHPDEETANIDIDDVAHEVGQVIAVVDMMVQLGILDRVEIEDSAQVKWHRVGTYMHHVRVDASTRTASIVRARCHRPAKKPTKKSTKRPTRPMRRKAR